ncbi:hypothetical protein UlMin_036381 [Ulmus minor]
MKFSKLIILFLLSFLFQSSQSTSVLVDGVSEWNNPIVHIGDSVIFQHKYHYPLYIFQNQRAYNVCNFTQATLLIKSNSTSYSWHPSRPGFFYFSFRNGSLQTCQGSQKLAIRVSSSPAPESSAIPPQIPPMAAPSPTSGGVAASSPAYPWPFRPKQAASPSPGVTPSLVPDKGGGIPFINSNPAVPLPTGEVDSATIRPLPVSSHGGKVLVGLFTGQMGLFCLALLTL